MGFRLGFIDFFLLRMHASGGYHPDFGSFSSQCESYVQKLPFIRSSQCVKSCFNVAVFFIVKQEQGFIKEDLFRLYRCNAMFFTFPGIAIIPIETLNLLKIDHRMYITMIYIWMSPYSQESSGSAGEPQGRHGTAGYANKNGQAGY
jgi:hypothetical protein